MSQRIKIVLLVMALMLMASLAVLATPIITDVHVSDAVNGVYTITAKISESSDSSALPSKQVTMLVYKQGETPSESNIIGIDQVASDASGNATFTMGTDSTTTAGTYAVIVGGEDVDTVGSPTAPLTLGNTSTGYKISGTITGSGNAAVTVTAKVGGNDVQGITVDQATGAYSIPALADGAVASVTIAKKGHITYTKDITISGADVAKDVALLCGDVTADTFINVEDLSAILAAWNSVSGDTKYGDGSADVNGDTFVNVEDLSLVLSNWNKTSANYPN